MSARGVTTRGCLWLLSGALSITTLGCDSQVGDDYTGEVMLTLRGHVDAPPDGRSDLVPTLAFYTSELKDGGQLEQGRSYQPTELRSELELVDGAVKGEYPSSFTLTVTEPPSQRTRAGGGAMGSIMLVPSDHPPRIEYPSEEIAHFATPEHAEDPSISSEERRRWCLSNGACLERELRCQKRPCELLEARGEKGEDEGVGWGRHVCTGSSCWYSHWDCAHDESCYREFWRCDLDEPNERRSDHDHTEVCEVTRETGDAAVIEVLEYPLVARNIAVFFAEPSLAAAAGTKPGYFLTEFASPGSDTDWIEQEECRIQARIRAVKELNTRLGTDYRYQLLPDDASSSVHEREDELIAGACPLTWIVSDPSSVSLRLDLTVGSQEK